MIDAAVARRYARALLEVAAQAGWHEKTGEELNGIAAALAHPEARAVLANPSHGEASRLAVVKAVAARVGASPALASFVGLLVERQRIEALPAIARAYGEMLDARVGRLRATVTSAYALSAEELARVQAALAAATGKSVVLDQKTDPSIIGGLIAQVGATVWDGSLRTQLQRMRDGLKQAAL